MITTISRSTTSYSKITFYVSTLVFSCLYKGLPIAHWSVMAALGQSVLRAHVTGACLVPTKCGAIPVVGPSDVDCGCISALVLAAKTNTNSAFRRASLSQYAAKALTFAGRSVEAIPFAAQAVTLFEAAGSSDALGVLCAKADLALALGCSGQAYWQRATELWASVQTRLKTLAGHSTDAAVLLQHVQCDKHIAIASASNTRALRASALRKAFAAAKPIQHPFFMRIVVELELLGAQQ